MINHLVRVLLVLLAMTHAPAAFAEQRALLVGVGRHSVPGIDLPGIDLDLEPMQDTLNMMGFDDSRTHQLPDDKATCRNLVREFESWLKHGV